MKFVRYGNLKAQYHKRPKSEKDWDWHDPPTEYGFYAFPRGYEELYLIGGLGSGNIRNGRYHFLRDSKGNKIMTNSKTLFADEWDDKGYSYLREPFKSMLESKHISYKDVILYIEDKDGVYDDNWHPYKKGYIAIQNKKTRFEYNGNIWHHLYEYDGREIVKKTDIISVSGGWVLTDIKTYEKALNKYVALAKSRLMFDKWLGPAVVGRSAGMPMHFSKDEFEVYIEDIQKEKKNN